LQHHDGAETIMPTPKKLAPKAVDQDGDDPLTSTADRLTGRREKERVLDELSKIQRKPARRTPLRDREKR
jgi:hypothetical protein